jgi:hypothetical protein
MKEEGLIQTWEGDNICYLRIASVARCRNPRPCSKETGMSGSMSHNKLRHHDWIMLGCLKMSAITSGKS